jgi:DNA-binding transcriptional LysR family regulator
MLNLHRMRLLVELHRRGTIAEVARALSYSPSSVSQQLGQLESEAGVQLLEPVGRKVQLTSAAEILVRHAIDILERVDRAEAALAATRSDIIGDIRVATFQTAAIALIPEVLDVMEELHPALTLYLTDFADVPWVLEPKGKPAREWTETTCRAAGFEPLVRFESADLLVHSQLAETGHAAALLPDLVWDARPAAAGFVTLRETPSVRSTQRCVPAPRTVPSSWSSVACSTPSSSAGA